MATNDEKTPFQRIMGEFADAFVTDTRNDGQSFHKLADASPRWMTDAIHAAHDAIGGRLPNDWTYAACATIAEQFSSATDAESARGDALTEICDGLVDIYNADRLRWLADHLDNAGLCDEAREEREVPEDADMFDRIAAGQMLAYERIAHAIVTAIDERATEDDES